jgi:hypothetical protein
MSSGHFLPTTQVVQLLSHHPAQLVEIALELRSIVLSISPQATERIRHNSLSYHDANRGGPVSAGICGIEIYQDHVRLSFIHGAFLYDPFNLLQGERRYKNYAVIERFEHAPWEAIDALIRASAGFDPCSLADSV